MKDYRNLALGEEAVGIVPQEGGRVTETTDGFGGGVEVAELFAVDQLAETSQNSDPVGYDLAGDRAALVPEMVRAGDNLMTSVAKRYRTTVEALVQERRFSHG